MKSKIIHILGPCSAENREQVMVTARMLKEVCDFNFIFRAGVWKPRTSPSSFQGAGTEGLVWLQEVKQQFGIEIATEVATPAHVTEALQAGIDYLWIGARTSANPIAVQEIAEEIGKVVSSEYRVQSTEYRVQRGLKGIFIKNPVNEDAALWLGNIERLEQTGIPVMAIHRGCAHKPCWAMAHYIRTQRPDIPILLDPSHMSGDATKIPALMKKIDELQLDGAMIEVHHSPQEALSDARQQIKPEEVGKWSVVSGQRSVENQELNWLRAEIDELDDQLWETIARRMEVSERIGEWKKEHGVQALQPQRYAEIIAQRKEWAEQKGLSEELVQNLFDAIHQESLKKQK
ncbi:MAG: bifunctional 3-deoxy-7-phosphoheptulonate synthase/chorismate mutase type II [Paludibacteraceae bacterium]|nr:bifunctional 3-deoxy-7-phosphoheptulonate synthase/chorismate mutase type II [Paludibacteraceae bacterium]